ncbi:MAG TPA: hypothetical protein VLJ42_02340 [Solirubrobacteraceae bacterium]|nr:hypothetical protein [Solirubrobacteraceae bacterium]
MHKHMNINLKTSALRQIVKRSGSGSGSGLGLGVKRSALGLIVSCVLLLTLAPAALANFGVSTFDGLISDANGDAATQAGSHPFEVTSVFSFNRVTDSNGLVIPDGGNPKDAEISLPPGIIGDPNTTPTCTSEQLILATCPDSNAVGTVDLTINYFLSTAPSVVTLPVYNMVPPPGKPGEYGFIFFGFQPTYISAKIRTGEDYGLTVTMKNLAQGLNLLAVKLNLWGVPADPSHDSERGNCAGTTGQSCPSTAPARPFITLPTSCPGPLPATLRVNSWQNPDTFQTYSFLNHNRAGVPVGAVGCDQLNFSPKLTVLADNNTAGAPNGLSLDLGVPQNGLPTQLAEAHPKQAALVLPPGMGLSPSGLAGLQGCPQEQFGYTNAQLPNCPDASKVGLIQIDSPLFTTPMTGAAYLAQPGANPFHAPLVLYGYAIGPTGVLEKFAGPIIPNQTTGQLTIAFDNLVQLPFYDFKMKLFGGPHGLLANPPTCGLYPVVSQVTAWSGAVATPFSGFPVNAGCSNLHSFAPSFAAGTTNNQAGASTPFTMTLSRTDQDQNLGALSVQTPPGLLGLPGPVPLCAADRAAQGTCDPSSLIGHATLGAGPGPSPLYSSGQVFLTGPYKGAPFGLSIVVPLQTSTFNLGGVVVRAAVSVDPHTSGLTIATDPLPQMVSGVPLQLKTVNLTLDRTSVMLNPTNCTPLTISGVAFGAQGASAPVSSRFQASNCALLPFKPTLAATIGGSHKNGASLRTDVLNAAGSANLQTLKLVLPKQLSPRAATLHHACPQATFAANPAACPAASVVGTGTTNTPVLPVPISGPAYLVAHGSGTPDLDVVLQGYGVTLVLNGSMSIKRAITTVAFNSIPDVPTSKFELSLAAGSHSLLAMNTSLCNTLVTVQAALKGQNNAQLKTAPKAHVLGCPKAKQKSKTVKKRKAPAKSRAPAKSKAAGRHRAAKSANKL